MHLKILERLMKYKSETNKKKKLTQIRVQISEVETENKEKD